MADYTLVVRVRFSALDDIQARRSARQLLERMHQREVCPDAQLVLRHQQPDASRNLLCESSSD